MPQIGLLRKMDFTFFMQALYLPHFR